MEQQLKLIEKNKRRIERRRPITRNTLEQIRKYYRILLTHTSTALEGNTLSISETKVILEDGLAIGGHPLREHCEVTGHANAYEYMWSHSMFDHITLKDMEWMIRRFCEAFLPCLPWGYRQDNSCTSGYAYEVTAFENVPAKMAQLAEWMEGERGKLHPVVFAAELHRRFMYIHPFPHSNGPTARLLMNLALLQEGYEIICIPVESREAYMQALEQGYTDPLPFNHFILQQEIEAQNLMMRLFHIRNKQHKR